MANGPQSAELVRQLVARLPPMKPLLMVLKIFLQQREMNEARAPWTLDPRGGTRFCSLGPCGFGAAADPRLWAQRFRV